jgi:hypothetical protein
MPIKVEKTEGFNRVDCPKKSLLKKIFTKKFSDFKEMTDFLEETSKRLRENCAYATRTVYTPNTYELIITSFPITVNEIPLLYKNGDPVKEILAIGTVRFYKD